VQRVRRVRPSSSFLAQLDVWQAVGYECWSDAARTTPKREYLAYLDTV
jgi:hypothetical protein